MKVLLTAVNSQYFHSNLAIRYLKAYTEDLHYECKLAEYTINDRKENVLQRIMEEEPDVIAFSCYIWNFEYVQALATLIKAVNKDIVIIFGGPEVSYEGEKFLSETLGDYVIEGEGEEPFRELIEYLLHINKDLNRVKGIYYRDNNNIKYTGMRENIILEKIVFPYTEKDDLKNKIVYYEASRGCPFNCKYCLSSTIKNVRFHELERVKKDLTFLMDKKVKLIKFVDRTFNANSKFAMGIWEFLINVDTDTSFHFEISADLLKPEEIQLLSGAPKGRFQFEVGVQTTNNEVLRNINRFVDFEKIKERVVAVKRLNNIMQHLDLIAGLPGENFESFKKSFNDVYAIRPDEIQLGFLKLIKGSPMRMEAEQWEMAYSPYPPYEILKTKDISYKELVILKRVEKMVNKYYNTQKFNNIIEYFEDKFTTPFEFYYELGEFYHARGYFNRNLSSTDYYKAFIEFNEEKLGEDSTLLKEIIKFDYLRFNKKKWVPEFLERDFDKKEAREIRVILKESEFKDVVESSHVEKFKLDILNYIEKKELNFEETYLLFYEGNEDIITNISNLLKDLKIRLNNENS